MATTDWIKQGEVIRASDIVSAFNEKAPVNMTPSGTTTSNTIPANSSTALTSILQTIINNLRYIFNNIAISSNVLTRANAMNLSYPVGSIYLSISGTNPGSLFGGTWVAWGQGRTIIGMGQDGGTNFNTVEKKDGVETVTLGEIQIPGHTHDISPNPHYHSGVVTGLGSLPSFYTGGGGSWGSLQVGNSGGNTVSKNTGGGSHNNLPPYITCYMWKRTA
jgi:hypothetical protein